MLSGNKLMPRDQFCQVKKSSSDSDGSDEERKDSSSRKGKHERLKWNQKKRKSSRYDSFDKDDEDLEREMGRLESESDSSLDRDKGRSKRRRSRSSRYDNSNKDDEASKREKERSETNSDDFLDRDEERRSKRRRRRRKSLSEDSYSSEEYEKKKRKKEGRRKPRKPRKESRQKRDEGKDELLGDEDDKRVFVARNDKELAGKELGLEWMLRSGSKVDSNRIQVASQPEKPIVEEFDALGSEGQDTSGPHDHLSQVLGLEHSERVRCRHGYTPTSYWSEASSSSHAYGTISREQLDEVLAHVTQAEERAFQAQEHVNQLVSIVRAMATQLSAIFGDDFSRFQDMLASFSAPAPPTPATAISGPTAAPPGDDEIFEDVDFDLANF